MSWWSQQPVPTAAALVSGLAVSQVQEVGQKGHASMLPSRARPKSKRVYLSKTHILL
jgi:hypothetical protein